MCRQGVVYIDCKVIESDEKYKWLNVFIVFLFNETADRETDRGTVAGRDGYVKEKTDRQTDRQMHACMHACIHTHTHSLTHSFIHSLSHPTVFTRNRFLHYRFIKKKKETTTLLLIPFAVYCFKQLHTPTNTSIPSTIAQTTHPSSRPNKT